MSEGTTVPERPFLTARWENLVLLNFDCPEELLEPLTPAGTELDSWGGSVVVSLVGFHFVNTRLRGVRVPGHTTFEEVNLRFYVRRDAGGRSRRGVVFVREVVPRRAIALVARVLYNEPYRAAPMTHRIEVDPTTGGRVEYGWRAGGWHRLEASVQGPARKLAKGTEAEFITEHYWGYTRQRDGTTLEYRVDHPPWRVWEALTAHYTGAGPSGLYPQALYEVLTSTPRSAFVALGSEVAVYPGEPL